MRAEKSPAALQPFVERQHEMAALRISMRRSFGLSQTFEIFAVATRHRHTRMLPLVERFAERHSLAWGVRLTDTPPGVRSIHSPSPVARRAPVPIADARARRTTMNELCTKGAMELAAMIASGKTTSAEVVDAHLARIEEVNPHLNAVTVTMADAARAAAAAVDEAAAGGAPLGPLAGVPFTVKENIDVAGSATTWGVAALAEQIASADARRGRHRAVGVADGDVADLRLVFRIIAAPDPDARDPRRVPVPLEGPRVDGRIRVAVVRDPAGAGIDPHVRAGIERAADWLADAGYNVVDAEPPHIAEAAARWFEVIWADVGTLWPGMEPIAGSHETEFALRATRSSCGAPPDRRARARRRGSP